MKNLKKILPILITTLITLNIVSFIHPATTYAQADEDTETVLVDCGDRSMLKIPTWYEYLQCDPVTGKPEFRSPTGSYDPQDALLILMAIIDMLLRLAGILAVVYVMVGGFKYITSQGSPESVNNAKNTIIYAVVGLVITIIASGIVSFIARSIA